MKLDPKPEYLKNKPKYERGAVHTHPSVKDYKKDVPEKASPIEGCENVTSCFFHAAERFPDRNCMGYRPIKEIKEKEVEVEGVVKLWKVPVFDDIVWYSYKQIIEKVVNFGDGLRNIAKLTKGGRICIYEETRYEWFVGAHGAWRQGFVITTAYHNLGLESLFYCLKKAQVPACLLNAKSVETLIKNEDKVPDLKILIYLDKLDNVEELKKQTRFEIYSFDEVMENGKKNPVPEETIEKEKGLYDDYCVLMFTSGSTGQPKAVMVKQANFLAAMYSAMRQLSFREQTVFISYLPLAHILELEAENCVLCVGGSLGFGNPQTLTDTAAEPCGDIRAFRPTVMLGVPRVWDTVRKVVFEKLSKITGLKKRLINAGMKAKMKSVYTNENNWFWNWLVFNKFKQMFGGRLEMLASGAAPLSGSTHELMAGVFDVPFCQGYGLTEVCGACTGQDTCEFSTDNVGYTITTAMIRLESVEEMGYTIHDQPLERGEICVAGHVMTGGYFEEPEMTAEAWVYDEKTKMVWFHTGDIGQWNEDGQLKVIDRKKNLIKLSGGEYVAVLNLEGRYQSDCPWVAPNGIFVHADPTRNKLVCVVQPQKSYLLDWAEENGKEKDLEKLVKDKEVNALVLDALKQVCEEQNMRKMEQIFSVHLTLDEWTPENGLMTASSKLRRKPMTEKYKDILEELFESINEKKDPKILESIQKQRAQRKEKKEEEEEEGEGEEVKIEVKENEDDNSAEIQIKEEVKEEEEEEEEEEETDDNQI